MKRVKFFICTLVTIGAASFTMVNGAVAQDDGSKSGRDMVILDGNASTHSVELPQTIKSGEEKDYVFLFGNVHRDTAVLRVLLQNAPDYFNAPDMPRFAIIGKERKFYLGIGGFVKSSVSVDLGNPVENPLCFATSSIPMDNRAGDDALLQMSAGASNLFFNFVALPHTRNQIGAYFNFDFSGNNANYGFSLKSAYLTYKGFLIGYNPSLFTDGAASAPTVDQQGPNAMTFLFNAVIDYQYRINSHWKVGAGLELPVVDATYNNRSYAVNQRIPDIPFYGQYSWADEAGWIRVSGVLRNMYYRDIDRNKNRDIVGYGVKLSGCTPLGGGFKMFYQSVFGEGISSYIQDMQGLGLDMVPVTSGDGADGTLKRVSAWGSYLGFQWQISNKFLTSATFSMVESDLPESEYKTFVPGREIRLHNDFMPSDTYKSAKYVVANLFYNITPYITAGVEYLWGCRENVNGEFKQDTRLQSALRVNF